MKNLKKLGMGLLTITLAATLLAGCSKNAGNANEKTGEGSSEWPTELNVTIAVDENNPDAADAAETLLSDLSDELGIKVNLLENQDYSIGIEALKNKKTDILMVTPMSYYQAKQQTDIVPLVTTNTTGASVYKTVFVTKGDNTSINKLADLKGKTFAFVDPASSSGYMYPKAKLVTELKLDPDKLENPDYFFKTVTYSGKHDSSLMGVVNGDYDAAAVAQQIIDSLVKADMIKEDDVKIIDETDPIPNPCFIARESLPADLIEKVKTFLENYDNKDYFKATYGSDSVTFVEAKDSDYDIVAEMVKTLNIKEEK